MPQSAGLPSGVGTEVTTWSTSVVLVSTVVGGALAELVTDWTSSMVDVEAFLNS